MAFLLLFYIIVPNCSKIGGLLLEIFMKRNRPGRHTDKHTDRQTDIQTNRDRESDREKHRKTDKQTE